MQKIVTDICPYNQSKIITTKKRIKLKKIKKLKKRNNIIHSNQISPKLNENENKINILNNETNKNPFLSNKLINDNDKSPFKINIFNNIEKSPNLFNGLKDKENKNIMNNINEVNNEIKLFGLNDLNEQENTKYISNLWQDNIINNNNFFYDVINYNINQNLSPNMNYDCFFDFPNNPTFHKENNNERNNNEINFYSPFKNINNNNFQINNINTPPMNRKNFNINTQVCPIIEYCFDNNNSIIINRQNNINNNNSINLNNQNNINNEDHFLESLLLFDEELDFYYGRNNRNNREINNIKKKLNKTKINKILELDDNKKNCIICFEDFKKYQNVYILPCSHIFHVRCFNKEIKLRQRCPICRNNL